MPSPRPHILPLALLVAVILMPVGAQGAELSPAAQGTAVTGASLRVRYLGNEGFAVDGGGHRVLIDALFGDGIVGYAHLPEPLRSEVENGVDGFAGVSLAIATHYHGDHFDPGAVARFLVANPTALFVSTPQAVQRLRDLHPQRPEILARCRAVFPAPGTTERLEIAGMEIDILNLHHGEGSPPVENLGVVLRLGERRFLHFGDTEAKMEDFAPYLGLLEGTDLALLPFWFLASEWRADLVRQHLRPRFIVIAHTPLPTAPASHFARWGSYDNLLEVMRSAFPAAVLPATPGEAYEFPLP